MAVSRALSDSVWPAVPTGGLVLVPVGSTEQHGPHLPLDTDTVIAHAVARRCADALPTGACGPLSVAPPLAYGASGEHADFPGTVSIGHEALRAVIVELVRSLSLWAGRVVFVNGHGGNTATLDGALGQLRAEGHDVAWTGCEVPGGDAHAGRTETSLMLHLTPERVRPDAAVAGDTRPLAVLLPELMARGVRAVSPSGVIGDPAGASAGEGRRAMDAMASAAVRRIDAWTVDGRGRLVDRARTPRPGAVRR
ncbi:mycofactocin biosynthesis peptidyl-dipeptidase MftE (plasmid) [Streptomyces sp. NBC_00080]|uniref:mycofactocin biosynthesis peptidyl-dipeptidase MftE n=1 Tax=unclassified Streptomyces TaxID=2593676 RepID=UPI001154582F|nr:mycofactocin biosynthesis peptidyl-dipeptidase MftE [Streptomyces sp. SLBN-115]TQJ37895.1 creatinine amidohydrolase [Streptomyces sp. SLBN-115]